VTGTEQWTYWRVLRGGRVAPLLVGDMISNTGDGMIITALPLLTLRIHGGVSPALAIAAVETSPYVLATLLAFTIGLGRVRVPPRALLVADCVLRAVLFSALGLFALAGRLTLVELIVGLLVGSVFRLVALSSRRLVATALVPPAGRLAVNGLLGTSGGLASYAVGPVVGGVLATVANPGVALLADGLSFVLLLVVVCYAVAPQPGAVAGKALPASGWRILRRLPVAARLFGVDFCFNLFYMPVEVALPLLVRGPLHGNGAALGTIWAGFGVGAVLGAAATNLLRRFHQQRLLVAIIAGWGVVVVLLAVAPSVPVATAVFFLGGLVYAPFTPVAYTFVQSVLSPDEQQPVLTLWSAGSALAAPVGLALAGPLVQGVGETGGLVVSAILTIALVPLAGIGLLRRRRPRLEDVGT
jgi:MFS family permease